MQNSKEKVFKNVIFLTGRTFFSIFLAFFTTRVIFKSLGVVDYGIFNVIGGIIAFLGFFNNSLISSTQRFFSFEIGIGNEKKITLLYNASIRIHIFVSVLILIIGMCFRDILIENFLNIPIERISSAKVVYTFVLGIFIFNVINVPFQALISSYEDMHVIATRGLIESILKFIIAIGLTYTSRDKLEIYSLLLFLVYLLLTLSYYIYCRKMYDSARLLFHKIEKRYYNLLLGFAGWTTFGSIAALSRNQGLNVILNLFFGPIMNTAYGFGNQINGQIQSFSSIILKPFEPQIIKSYSVKNYELTYEYLILSSRFSVYIALLISFPFLIWTNFILDLWLDKAYPVETILIVRLILVNLIISVLGMPLITIIQSSGKIRNFQLLNGGLFIINIPLAYILLYFNFSYYSIFISLISISVISTLIKVYFANSYMNFSIFNWFYKIILKTVIILLLTLVILYLLNFLIVLENIFSLTLMKIIISEIILLTVVYFYGISLKEKKLLINKLKSFI